MRSDGTSETTYSPTYYPSAATKERASVVEVAAGGDAGGLEIRLTRAASQPILTIGGTVTGMPPDALAVLMVSQAYDSSPATMAERLPVLTDPDGRFSLSGLTPGVYNLMAQCVRCKTPLQTRIELESSDATNVELALRPPGELAGTLRMGATPAADAPADQRTVHLQPAGDTAFGTEDAAGQVNRDGSFRIANVWPGRFHLLVEPLPPAAYVKTVELDGATVADGLLELSGTGTPRVKITVALDGAVLSGKVLDKDGEPVSGPLVSVFLLADPKHIQDGKETRLEDGKYSLQGIRPGKYRLFAFDSSGLPDDFDALWRERAQAIESRFAAAEEIEIRSGDRVARDLQLTGKEAADAGKQ